jgi:hypothetical protein
VLSKTTGLGLLERSSIVWQNGLFPEKFMQLPAVSKKLFRECLGSWLKEKPRPRREQDGNATAQVPFFFCGLSAASKKSHRLWLWSFTWGSGAFGISTNKTSCSGRGHKLYL